MLRKRLEVGPYPAEVRRARDWVRAQLPDSCPEHRREIPADTVVLLVSELVTNAVVHTGRPAVLRLRLPVADADAAADAGAGVDSGSVSGSDAGDGPEVGALRLEVADASGRPPFRRTARRDEPGGRGLELVDLLADRWGWQREGIGKSIWCELDIPVCERGHEVRKVPARY